MCQLTIDDLTAEERAAMEQALANLDPYLTLFKVEWMAEPKETNS